MSTTSKCGVIVASFFFLATAGAGDVEAPQPNEQMTSSGTVETSTANSDDALEPATADSGSNVPDDTEKAPVATTSAARAAAARGLQADEQDEAVPVRICRREKTTGTRVGRKVCRTVQEIERAAQMHGVRYDRDANRFERVPMTITPRNGGGGRGKPKF